MPGVIYHHQCYFNFVTKKYIPNEYLVKMDAPLRKPNLKSGRPENVAERNAFIKVCKFTSENEYGQFTQLSEKMDEFLIKNDESAYNTRYLKIQLKAEFCDKLLFSNSPGQTDIITLKRTVDSIIRGCFENCKSSCIEAQEQIIIQTAAMLIINDIKENVSTAKEFYPFPEDHTSENCINYLPRSLYIFLNKIATGTKKEKKRKLTQLAKL